MVAMSAHKSIWPTLRAQRWIALGWFVLAAIIAVGEILGWWHDLGLLGLLTTGFGVLSYVTAATAEQVERLMEPIERMADDMATVKRVLERIADRLGA